ncbi:MAG: hypothetical protein ACE5I7_16580 [Candidatus Binatia bacterium]
MTARALLSIAGLLAGLPGPSVEGAYAVQACPDAAGCAQVRLGSATGMRGDTVRVRLAFAQGPDDGQPGGVDEIVALALTLNIDGVGIGPPLTLADCTLQENGLPKAITPDPSLANFKVVVENASCAGRTHCLCPDPVSGIRPDVFVNLAIFGPDPLRVPGTAPNELPPLPSGPLLAIDFKIGSTAAGTVTLHVFNEASDNGPPPFGAFVSAGDRLKVDQTCVPVAGLPLCSGTARVSQVATFDGSITVVTPPTATGTKTLTVTATDTPTPTRSPTSTPLPTSAATVTATRLLPATETPSAPPTGTATPTQSPTPTPTATPMNTTVPAPSLTPPRRSCVGDCDDSGAVTIDEVVTMINIALGTAPPAACTAGDANGNGDITVDEILAGVNNVLNGCMRGS